MKEFKQICIKLAVLLFVSLICLIIIEIFFRLDACNLSSDLCQKTYKRWDRTLAHELIPNAKTIIRLPEYSTEYKINSFGMRDKEFYFTDGYSILMLGDSSTQGLGVSEENTFASLLERRFRNNNLNVEVWNAGVESYSPIIHCLYLKENLGKIKPDMVIMNLDLSDIQDDFIYEKFAVYDSNGELIGINTLTDKNILKNVHRFLRNNLFSYYYFSVELFRNRTKGYEIIPASYVGDISSDKYFLTRFNLSENKTLKYYNITFNYIKRCRDLSEKGDAKFVLVSYPMGSLVKGEWNGGRKINRVDEFDVYSLNFFKRLKDFAEKENITYIDTYELFVNATKHSLFYYYDPHMTGNGTDIVAEGIYRGLLDSNLIIKE